MSEIANLAPLERTHNRARARSAFDELLRSAGRRRPLWRVGLEWGGGAAPELSLTEYRDAEVRETTHARCEPHGAWIEWLADGSDRGAICG